VYLNRSKKQHPILICDEAQLLSRTLSLQMHEPPRPRIAVQYLWSSQSLDSGVKRIASFTTARRHLNAQGLSQCDNSAGFEKSAIRCALGLDAIIYPT
jgi:hypothetical protein